MAHSSMIKCGNICSEHVEVLVHRSKNNNGRYVLEGGERRVVVLLRDAWIDALCLVEIVGNFKFMVHS